MLPAWLLVDTQLDESRDHDDIPCIKEKQELSNCPSVKYTNTTLLWGQSVLGLQELWSGLTNPSHWVTHKYWLHSPQDSVDLWKKQTIPRPTQKWPHWGTFKICVNQTGSWNADWQTQSDHMKASV